MYIPTKFPIIANRPKPARRSAGLLEKSESDPDSAKQLSNSHVLIYDKREREDRRKNKIKPLIDTRSGRDRRYDKESRSIDIEA